MPRILSLLTRTPRFCARARPAALVFATTMALLPGRARAQLSVAQTWTGPYDYVVTGNTVRTQSNTGNACAVTTGNTTATLSGIPAGATVEAAYLYWGGSGPVDNSITFAGSNISPDRTMTSTFSNGTNYPFFGAVKDVTSMVTGNGTYTVSNLNVGTGTPWCGSQAVAGAWELLVVYQVPGGTSHKLELRDGLRAFQGATETVNLTGFTGAATPDARFTFAGYDGDDDIDGTTQDPERIRFNNNTLSDARNPAANPFNSTVNSQNRSNVYGLDLDTYNASSFLAAGATTATLQVTAGDDMFVLHWVMTIVGITPTYAIATTPDGFGPVQRLPGTGYLQAFQVTNNSTVDINADVLLTRTGTPLFVQTDSMRGTGVPANANGDSTRVAIPFGESRTINVFHTVPAGVGATNTLTLRGRIVGQPTVFDNGTASVQRVSPKLALSKSVSPSTTQAPGTDLTYTLAFSNQGDFAATSVVVNDSVPTQVTFKLGSTGITLPAGITAVTEYSTNGTTWTYVPVSAGCGAPAGYDACVRRIRWRLQQALPAGVAASASTASFVARIK